MGLFYHLPCLAVCLLQQLAAPLLAMAFDDL
jgi:hypothetical protein